MAARTSLAKTKLEAFATRLRKARIAAGCPSIEAGARHCKTVSSAYTRHEKAQLMATVMMIERYAAAFKVDPCWLAFGTAARIDNFRARPGSPPGSPSGTKPAAPKQRRRPWQSKYV